MILPNHDLSSIADPGSMDADAMTEPDNDTPGDLDEDHQDLAEHDDDHSVPSEPADSSAAQGGSLGPPD